MFLLNCIFINSFCTLKVHKFEFDSKCIPDSEETLTSPSMYMSVFSLLCIFEFNTDNINFGSGNFQVFLIK